MKTILSLICFCAAAMAQPGGVGVFPPPTKPMCTATRTTNCTLTDVSGTTTVPGTLSVGATVSAAGSTATDSASLGVELIDATGWTSTDWTGSYPFTHTPGNATALSRAITGMANGTYWQVVLTISGRTAGSVDAHIGGSPLFFYSGEFAGNTAYTRGPMAVSAAALTITPTTDFDGTVSVSVKRITAIPRWAFESKDSAGNAVFRVSQQLSSLNNMMIGGGGLYNTTGTHNTFNGMQAGLSNTTGTYNTFSGTLAGLSNTTGYSNTFNGMQAGYSNTTGTHNTFSGTLAGYSNTTGYYNTFSGTMAGLYNTTGHHNTFSGTMAGYSNTTGTHNTFSGTMAGFYNTTGHHNTFSGTQAGYSNTTGTYNTFSGMSAGYTATPANASATGAHQVLLGYNSGQASATQRTYLTVIGSEALGDCSNCGVLGKAGQKWGVGGVQNPLATFHVYDPTVTTGATTLLVSLGAADSATTVTVSNAGTTKSAGYQSADGSAGVTVTTCTSFKNGLCVAGT